MKKHLIELKTKTDTHTQTIAQTHSNRQTNNGEKQSINFKGRKQQKQ